MQDLNFRRNDQTIDSCASLNDTFINYRRSTILKDEIGNSMMEIVPG
jgi:hypothetical protein